MTGCTRMNRGQSASVSSKKVKSAPCGSVLLVPTNTAWTFGRCFRYAVSAGFMDSGDVVRSRWYWAVVAATNSSTSAKGSGGRMYSACRRDGKGVVVQEDSGGTFLVEECRLGVDGSEARIRISRTRQSLPPL